MKASDILKLSKVGFTLEQIVQIDETLGLDGDPELMDPKPEPAPEPDPEPAPEPEPKKDDVADAVNRLNTLLDKIQRTNVFGKDQPAREEETVDTILASIIQGPKPGQKEG